MQDGEGTPLERTLDAAADALDELADCLDWLLWIDLATLLPSWDVPAEYAQRYFHGGEEEDDEDEESLGPLEDPGAEPFDPTDDELFFQIQRSFAGVVTYFDAVLGLLLEELDERGLTDEIVVLVTSDHGQALGEHGIVGPCRTWLHDELIHVPLLIRLPDGAEAGRRIAALTQPVDLHPTLLELFGVTPQSGQGRSLLPLVRGQVDQIRAYTCSGFRVGNAVEWALRTPDWALLLPLTDGERPRQLYVKPDDRWEVNNLVQHHLEHADHLEKTLRGFVEATRRPGHFVPPTLSDADSEGVPS
jgi:arylsulfatase A-like enzyme